MKWTLTSLTVTTLALTSCTPVPPPSHQNNVCEIFAQRPSWYWAAEATTKKWGISEGSLMAFMHEESGFHADIKTPRTKLLGFIPWTRESTAFGYSQALDHTWRWYQRDTRNYSANRDNFHDAADFIGWYADQTMIRLHVKNIDAGDLYLAYHEGITGFIDGTYRHKPWLINIAKRVQSRADIYDAQLAHCRSSLPQQPWYHFW